MLCNVNNYTKTKQNNNMPVEMYTKNILQVILGTYLEGLILKALPKPN